MPTWEMSSRESRAGCMTCAAGRRRSDDESRAGAILQVRRKDGEAFGREGRLCQDIDCRLQGVQYSLELRLATAMTQFVKERLPLLLAQRVDFAELDEREVDFERNTVRVFVECSRRLRGGRAVTRLFAIR